MTAKQIKEHESIIKSTIRALAWVYYKDELTVANKIEAFYPALKDVAPDTFANVVNKENKEGTNKFLQHPSYYRNECHKLESDKRVKTQTMSELDHYEKVRKFPNYGTEPKDIQAFLVADKNICESVNKFAKTEDARRANSVGFENVAQCLGGAWEDITVNMGIRKRLERIEPR